MLLSFRVSLDKLGSLGEWLFRLLTKVPAFRISSNKDYSITYYLLFLTIEEKFQFARHDLSQGSNLIPNFW